MRILLDTNVVIPLEDSSKVLEESLSELVRLSTEFNHQLVVHPSSYDDIQRDSDKDRREISISRFKKYPLIEKPPVLPDTAELNGLGLTQSDDNDRVDNEIIFAIYRDAANILVTEDRDVHKKAVLLGIESRVHYIQQATAFLKLLHKRVAVFLPNIKEMYLHEIDLRSNFFDSLRVDYEEFDDWYKRCSAAGRKAWVYQNEQGIPAAILIFKEERDKVITDEGKGLSGRILKLCTFKVGEEIRGRKIGELFLKAAFRFATDNKMGHIYIHMRPGKQIFLEDLCIDFGFYYFGEYKGDHVFVKDHPIQPPASDSLAVEYVKRYYPHFKCGSSTQIYIVPIMPMYHGILFPDNQKQPLLFTSSAAGNAIKQAYLCHAPIHGLVPGDILLFYRSHDFKAVTSIGIVESAHEYKDPAKIMEVVSKRTVYSYDDIVEMAQKKTKVILFRLVTHLPKSISYDWLLKREVVSGIIQTIRRITHESFRKVVKESGVNNCIFVD